MNRFELFSAMINRTPLMVHGTKALIEGMKVEDGSGYNFIVSVQYFGGLKANVFVRTSRDQVCGESKSIQPIEQDWEPLAELTR